MGWAVAAPAIATAFGAGATVYGAKKQSDANKAAANASDAATREMLAFEREKEMRRREEFDRVEGENARRWGIEADRDERRYAYDMATDRWKNQQDVDVYNAEQKRRQPYRDTSLAAVNDLARRAGLTVRPSSAPQLSGPPTSPNAQTMADLLAASERQKGAA